MATHNSTHHTLISSFIVGNLKADVTPKQVYKALGLDRYPSQSIIELDLAVDKRGRSRGYAFLQIPRSCSSKLRKQDGTEINGQKIYICYQEGNSHMFKDKKWVKKYKEDGMASSAIPKPRLIYKYKPARQSASSEKENVSIGPLCDMCAELTHRKFSSDLDKVIAHCYKLGVGKIVIPGRCRKQREEALELINQYSCYMDVYLSTGISPQHANEFSDEEKSKIESEMKLVDCLSVGPIGLDYKLTNVTKKQQMLAFEEQLKLACDKKTPVYLVEHDAHEDFVSILTKYASKLPKCAMVDVTGSLEELKKYVGMGFYIIISGSYNYTRSFISPVITDALSTKLIPTEKILLSSNSPKKSSEKFTDDMGFLYISSHSRNKLPLNMKRTEPLCVFLNLETVGKYLGYKSQTEIRDFGKETVKNSKTFLGLIKDKASSVKKRETISKPEYKLERRINKMFVVFALAMNFVAFMLEYFSGIPEFQEDYFSRQNLF